MATGRVEMVAGDPRAGGTPCGQIATALVEGGPPALVAADLAPEVMELAGHAAGRGLPESLET